MTDHLDGLPTGLRQSSTVLQDLTTQREILTSLGVSGDWIYLNKGLTGTNRARPGPGSGLGRRARRRHPVVPKLDRLARSVPDARDIGDTLVARGVRLSLGGSTYDPADPMSKMFFNMFAVFAEFEARSTEDAHPRGHGHRPLPRQA